MLSTMEDMDAASSSITLIAKWGKERITLDQLDKSITIAAVKDRLAERTGVLQKRQKLIGLALKSGGSKVNDNVLIGDLKVKNGRKREASGGGIVHEFIMMGTKEEQIFVDPSEKEDLPDVVDDFELDFNAGSSEVRKAQFLSKEHSCLSKIVPLTREKLLSALFEVASTRR